MKRIRAALADEARKVDDPSTPRLYDILAGAGEADVASHVAMARWCAAGGDLTRAGKLAEALVTLYPGEPPRPGAARPTWPAPRVTRRQPTSAWPRPRFAVARQSPSPFRESHVANPSPLVAIGDLHGHYPALEALLAALEIREGVFREAGSDRLVPGVTLVFTGDYIDRGTSALAVIERLKRLQERNPGRVITLMGNHELLALQHLDEARRLAMADPVGGILAYAGNAHGWNGGCEFVSEFGDPPGAPALPAYVGRMSREGDIGRWMRALLPSFETRVAGKRFLFTHGDLPEAMLSNGAFSRYGMEIAARMAARSDDMGGTAMKYGDRLLTSESASFFWCRDFAGFRFMAPAAVEAICKRVGTDFIVTGHTMHRGRIERYGGRIFDIDVGMTPAYGGNLPQALIVSRKGIAAFDAKGREEVIVPFDAGSSAAGREATL